MKWQVMKDRIQKAIQKADSPFTGYTFNEALSLLVRERFIARAAQSKMSSAFIFKGGLLLTLVYTKHSRYTKDADMNIVGANDLLSFQKAIDSITAVNLDDGFSFGRNDGQIISNDKREYDGAQFQIQSTYGDNQKQNFILDIGVGDAVKPVLSKLPTLEELDASTLEMQVYPPETIAAEKIQTCIQNGPDNSRMKDYYDLYFLREIVNIKKFQEAAIETFARRNTPYLGSLPEDEIEDSLLQTRWDNFLKADQLRLFRPIPKQIIEVMIAIREFYGTEKP